MARVYEKALDEDLYHLKVTVVINNMSYNYDSQAVKLTEKLIWSANKKYARIQIY